MKLKNGIKIQYIISFIVLMAIFSTTSVNWYVSSQGLKHSLSKNYLENNYEYAKKMAMSTSSLLMNMQNTMSSIATLLGEQEFSQKELDAWKKASSGYFNSLFITDEKGVIKLMSPQVINSVKAGTQLNSPFMKRALTEKKRIISNPYLAASGKLALLISYPIFDDEGNFKGVICGTIYLDKESSLGNLLKNHKFKDESSVYVVDRTGKIIYHPDSSRINESLTENLLKRRLKDGQSGSERIINKNGEEFFSGYAYEKTTGWGIISQTPTSVIKKPLQDLLDKVILESLPLLIFILFIGWIVTNHLSKPLKTLADYSEEATKNKRPTLSFNRLKFKSNILEIRQLYQHIEGHFQLLNKQIRIDGLTELTNRRTFDIEIEEKVNEKIPFSLIMLDIDYFKKVNDSYGHLVGDHVLKYLSSFIKDCCSQGNLCFRYGGEEFTIILEDTTEEDALIFAERLREKVAHINSPSGHPITISLGITAYSSDDSTPETVIQRADFALYQSKINGRNRTTIYHTSKNITSEPY